MREREQQTTLANLRSNFLCAAAMLLAAMLLTIWINFI
jgi:hypothetical protein